MAEFYQCCEVCGTVKDLRVAPMMDGRRRDDPAAPTICSACYQVWYEYDAVTPAQIMSVRLYGIARQ